ncbi:hypothetical protein AB0J83_36235 [Actinoplanes sp. NPDC049596]
MHEPVDLIARLGEGWCVTGTVPALEAVTGVALDAGVLDGPWLGD